MASFFGLVIGAVAIRFLVGPEALAGGVLPSFPASPQRVLRRAGVGLPDDARSADRSPASPALGALGGLSWLAFGSTAIAQKVVLAGAPALAAILMYRAAARLTGPPGRLGARGRRPTCCRG